MRVGLLQGFSNPFKARGGGGGSNQLRSHPKGVHV